MKDVLEVFLCSQSSFCNEMESGCDVEDGPNKKTEQAEDLCDSVEEDDDLESLKQLVNTLKQREKEVLREKDESEIDFGLKRARFMEMFKQKEGEVASERQISSTLQKENDELRGLVNELRMELDETKSQVAILECTKENEIEEERRKCRDEVASLQQIIDETMVEATRTKKEYDREVGRMRRMMDKLESELQDTKGQTSSSESKEGVLSVVTKTLAKRVPVLNAYAQSNENIHENLEDSMKKAQEDAEVLRSLVVPLEEEIRALKEKLRAADGQIQAYETNVTANLDSSTESADRKLVQDVGSDIDEKLKGLHEGLQAEKSSRSDLEMYVEVLQSQKATLVNEADELRKQLREVYELLDKEKREHEELKQTWHMANDQFLEAQKMQTDDMRRIRSLLTTEQQRFIQELHKKDSAVLKELVGTLPPPLEGAESQSSSKRSSPVSFPSSPRRRKSPSPARRTGTSAERSGDDIRPSDEFSFETERKDLTGKSLHESLSSSESTEEQVKDLAGDRDWKMTESGLHGRADVGLGGAPSKRLISDKEWGMIQEEMKNLKEKLAQPCDMCSNYEAQLQKAQDRERELVKNIKALEQSNEWHKSDLQQEQQARKELEDKLLQSSTEVHRDIAEMYNKMAEIEAIHTNIRQQFAGHVQSVSDDLKELTTNRESIDVELKRLQHDNDTLVGKYTENSRQMQNETIDLPNNMEDLQLMLLRLREELIVAKLAKEHIEETLRSEILFMKERAKDEQHNRDSTESMLTQEIDSLREKVGILESLKSQHESEQQRRMELQKSFQDLQQKYADSQAKHRQILTALQKRVEEGSKTKEKLEYEVMQLKCKIQTLQTDLDNSEAVQRDFVKLSQSLQVQLEKIRESKNEVRWQHEEDVNECTNCKQPFTVARRRHHCRHCGKIFCADCTSKVVPSGPNRRPSKVCDVCHTLLVQDTAPYFSTEPPHTPD